jgi:phosphatidylserine decarboxylase
MVRDGIYYAVGVLAVAALTVWLASPWGAIPLLLLGTFFLWFFRDPEREIPQEPGAIVSPADGKVTDISTVTVDGVSRTRMSIFLSVFDVHVNRSPIAGYVRNVEYRRGKFGNAMGSISSEQNEQNIVTVEGEGHTLVYKQIAGLLARRIVFTPRVGDFVERGARIGMIKFSSRVDVVFGPDIQVAVNVGDRVRGGSSVIARAVAVGSHVGVRQTIEQPLAGGRS